MCTNVTPGEPQVTLGSKDDKSFTFDYVFDCAESQERIFEQSVRGLVDGTLDGYNATVLAYGQTGSGKTYSMGTSLDAELRPEEEGIIPRAIKYLFQRIEARRLQNQHSAVQFSVTAQFMELYNEDMNDLFAHLPPDANSPLLPPPPLPPPPPPPLSPPQQPLELFNESLYLTGGSRGAFVKAKIEIHEDQFGAINLSNISTRAVHSAIETLHMLKMGAQVRTTGATNMVNKLDSS